uniref:Uncharacterized protein n=1 Tax=Arundo donax TaxID=35708 RepID=A0A0A9A4G8_ARUDO
MLVGYELLQPSIMTSFVNKMICHSSS